MSYAMYLVRYDRNNLFILNCGLNPIVFRIDLLYQTPRARTDPRDWLKQKDPE